MSQDKNILEKLFDGDYSPFDTIEINDEKYLQILDSAEKEHNFFKQFIPQEYQKRYEQLPALFFETNHRYGYIYYKKGLDDGLEIRNELNK